MQISFWLFLITYFLVHFLAVIIYIILFIEPNLWFNATSQVLYGISDVNIEIVFLISAVFLRFFELYLMQKALVLFHSLFGNLSLEFIAVLVVYFFIPFVKWNLYPFGLSTISRIVLYENDAVKYIIAVAFIYTVCCIIINIYVREKRIYSLLER